MTYTGTDLLVARTLCGLTQGQLATRSKLTALSIKDYETSGRDLPGWVVEQLADHISWTNRAEGRRQQAQKYVITVTGMTEFQFRQKLKGWGKYVAGVVRTESIEADQ